MSLNLANPVNWADPLNRGLKFWGLPVAGDHRRHAVIDLCRGSNLTVGGGSTFDGSASSKTYHALRCDAVGERAEITTPSHLQLGFPITLAFWFNPLGSASDGAGLFGVAHNNSDSNPYLAYMVGVSSDHFQMYWNASGTFGSAFTTFSYSGYTGWHHLVAVFDSTVTMWIDGVDVSMIGAGPGSNPTYDSTSLVAFGCYTGITSRSSNGRFTDGRIYNRALTLAEANQLRMQSILGYPTALNRIQPINYGKIMAGGGGGAATRPRSLLTLGCGC